MADARIPVLACGHDAAVLNPQTPGWAVCSKWCGEQEIIGMKTFPV